VPFTALLDASVLVPFPLADTLLRTAAAELYDPRWSPDIVEEVTRTLTLEFHLDPARVGRRIEHMRAAFPDAEVVGYRDLVPAMPVPDQGDRHVVAAALVGHAQLIVTSNVRHFPREALEPLGLDVQDPDQFLTHLYHLDPPVVRASIQEQTAALRNPPLHTEHVLRNLARVAPNFVALVRADLAG
jgi:hypothetical protein